MIRRAGSVAGAWCCLWPVTALAQNATTPGAVTTPYPTTQAIAIEWAITGDANNNGVVTVRYHEAGASPTVVKAGLPLIRVPAGANDTGDFGSGGGRWANKHAGSLFDLDPGTAYQIELTLSDPDGGGTTTTTTASTRPIPVAAAGAPTKAVTPATLSAALSSAAPGDILLLGAGSYAGFTMARSGATDRPIVIRGESADTVIVNGRVTMDDQNWVYLENVTVQGEVRLQGASHMVVRGCKVRTTGNGINMQIGDEVPRNNYIVDNDLLGGATWSDDQLGADGYNSGEGIQLTGSGHVVCWNHVKGFRDNISHMEYDEAFEQVSIDICNNDLEEATDDGVEADSAMGNVRVMRNRMRNCYVGCSSQPGLGGPTYFIRNVMYNVVYSPFKLHNGTVGDVVLHNTVVKCGDGWGCYAGETWSQALVRNNLFIGGAGGGTYGGYGNGSGRVLDLGDADGTCSFDYDGLGSIDTGKFEGKIGSTRFASLSAMQSSTTETHGVQVDMSIFASPPAFPASPFPPKPTPDLQLAAGSAAVDKGVVLTGINDGFTGTAPDLGAYELGAAPPVYGPRTSSSPVTIDGGAGQGGSSGTGGLAKSDAGIGTGGILGTGGRPRERDAGAGRDALASGVGGTTEPADAPSVGGALGTGGVMGGSGAFGAGGTAHDGGSGKASSQGCGCSTTLSKGNGETALLVVVVLALQRRRRRSSRPQ